MIFNRKIMTLLVSAYLCVNVNAQSYPQELLRYSMNDINGTARSIGVGGAFSTVGADLSNAFSNPAGLGLYRGTEISGGLGFLINNSTTDFLGTQSSSSRLRAYAPNIGAVLAVPIKRKGMPTNFFQASVAYQRLADFNTDRVFKGVNNNNSQIDGLFNEIMATNDPITYSHYSPGAVQAWDTYLIDYDSVSGNYYQRVHAPVQQSGTYRERGGSNEIAINFSGNVSDKVYVGAGIGIPWINYSRDIVYNETSTVDDSIYGFRNYKQETSYSASGVGVNFKLGVIVRPVPFWRIGASLTTPSWFGIRESMSMATTAALKANDGLDYTFPSDTFTSAPYRFSYTRPLKFTLGTSFYLKQWGFLSVDYELNDYQHTSLSFSGYENDAAVYNNQISGLYGIGHTVRTGVEVSPISVLRLRAGYAWNSSPIQSSARVNGYDLQQHNFTGGLGYRGKIFFADIAYAYTMGGNYQSLYATTTNEPAMLTKYTNHRIVLTFGVKFPSKVK